MPFRCRDCSQPLELISAPDGMRCARCGWLAGDRDGVLDFVSDTTKSQEAEYYDTEYTDARVVAPPSITSLKQLWVGNPYAPQNEALWRRMQDIKGKTVVVLGSGAAPRELTFLELEPACLVISDLSKAPLRALRDEYLPHRPSNVVFAAIDAEDLPFADESVDVVYGYLFVHHLPDVERFLSEAARVLRPGGRALFLDAAYAPIWEGSKRSWLRWAMRAAHRVNPISPEDMRFTLQGGFRIEDMERRIRALDGLPWFERSGAFHYLVVRASEILARVNGRLSLGQREWIPQPDADPPYALVWRNRHTLERLARLDRAMATRFKLVRRNQIRLAWGFEKALPPPS
jgi:SAM-dependent methyltransferase